MRTPSSPGKWGYTHETWTLGKRKEWAQSTKFACQDCGGLGALAHIGEQDQNVRPKVACWHWVTFKVPKFDGEGGVEPRGGELPLGR